MKLPDKSKKILATLGCLLVLTIGYIWFYFNKVNEVDYPVDMVYLWVNGHDEEWQKKKEFWQAQYGKLSDNAVNKARFRQFDELKYSLRSIEKNLPWLRYIFIVTDNQTPEWLNTNHPKIKMVNHTDIFPESALPTFNSVAIETRLPYIDELAEHFLFANDDNYVRVPLNKSFFFDAKGNPNVFVKFKKKTSDKNMWLSQIKKAHELVASKYPLDYAVTPSHNIDAYRKSYFLDTINEFKEEFYKTTHSKFRQPTDVQRIIVSLTDNMKNRTNIFDKSDYRHFPPTCNKAFSLISRDFLTLDEEMPCLFCLNDFEGKTDREILITLKILEYLFPEKSTFEK